jgi:putative endonuclease
MGYKLFMLFVYFLKSLKNQYQTYIGYTTNIDIRLKAHNAGKSIHTAKYKPGELIFYIAFKDIIEAKDFEKYLKTPSGKAFIVKRLLPQKK